MILRINKILRHVAWNKRKKAWAQNLRKNKQCFAEGKAAALEEDLCPYHRSAPTVIPVTYGFIPQKMLQKGKLNPSHCSANSLKKLNSMAQFSCVTSTLPPLAKLNINWNFVRAADTDFHLLAHWSLWRILTPWLYTCPVSIWSNKSRVGCLLSDSFQVHLVQTGKATLLAQGESAPWGNTCPVPGACVCGIADFCACRQHRGSAWHQGFHLDGQGCGCSLCLWGLLTDYKIVFT